MYIRYTLFNPQNKKFIDSRFHHFVLNKPYPQNSSQTYKIFPFIIYINDHQHDKEHVNNMNEPL